MRPIRDGLSHVQRYQMKHRRMGLCTHCSRAALPGLKKCEQHRSGKKATASGGEMNGVAILELSDVLNLQTFSRVFRVAPWTEEPNSLCVIREDSKHEITEILQSPDARTLYYAMRHTIRRREHDLLVSELSGL
jgi:hypothetical protein